MFINYESNAKFSFDTFRKPGHSATTVSGVWAACANEKEEKLTAEIGSDIYFSEEEVKSVIGEIESGKTTLESALAYFANGY